MELGETVCLPNGVPLCKACPVREHCKAYLTDTVERYPVKSEKKPRKAEKKTVFLIRTVSDGRYGVRKRPKNGLLADLWEFPNVKGHLGETEAISEFENMGLSVSSIRSIGTARHIFSHVEWDMIGYEVEVEESADSLVFGSAETIRREYAIPTAFRFFADAMK